MKKTEQSAHDAYVAWKNRCYTGDPKSQPDYHPYVMGYLAAALPVAGKGYTPGPVSDGGMDPRNTPDIKPEDLVVSTYSPNPGGFGFKLAQGIRIVHRNRAIAMEMLVKQLAAIKPPADAQAQQPILKCRSCGYVGQWKECCDHMNFDGASAEEAYQAAQQDADKVAPIIRTLSPSQYAEEFGIRSSDQTMPSLQIQQDADKVDAQQEPSEESEKAKWLASLFPEDRMFEEIDQIARESYRRHSGNTRGQMAVRADAWDSHVVWATKRWIEQNAPEAPKPDPWMAGDDRAEFDTWLATYGYGAIYRKDGTTKLPHEIAHSAWKASSKRVQPSSGEMQQGQPMDADAWLKEFERLAETLLNANGWMGQGFDDLQAHARKRVRPSGEQP